MKTKDVSGLLRLRLAKTDDDETGLLRSSQRRLNLSGLIVNRRHCEERSNSYHRRRYHHHPSSYSIIVFASLRSNPEERSQNL